MSYILMLLLGVGSGEEVLGQASALHSFPSGPVLPRFSNVSSVGEVRSPVIETYTETDDGIRLVGGIFNRVNGQTRLNLAAFDRDWNLLPYPLHVYFRSNPEHVGEVHAVAVHGSCVIIGGAFDTVNGQPKRALAVVDLKTGLVFNDTPELVPGGFLPPVVYSFARYADRLYVGGTFSGVEFDGVQRRLVSLLELELIPGVCPPSLKPLPTDFGLSVGDPSVPLIPVVFDMAVRKHALYVGGVSLGKARGRDRGNGAAFGLYRHGAALLDWNPRANEAIHSVTSSEVAGGRIFVGGSFAHAGGRQRAGLARLEPRYGWADTWRVPLEPFGNSRQVRFVKTVLDGDVLYVAGEFENLSGVLHGIAAFDARTANRGYWRPFLPGVSGARARSVFVIDDRVFVSYSKVGWYSYAVQRRGDANGDGQVSPQDALFILDHLFRAGEEPAWNPATQTYYGGDADNDGLVDVDDSTFLFEHLHRNGPAPAP